MPAVFADTFYWLALANPRDEYHAEAVEMSDKLQPARLLTTEEVLGEVLTWFASFGPQGRGHAARIVRDVLQSPDVEVLPQTHAGFLAALEFYERRLDKSYSLTDCVSMLAMRAAGITEVLSKDRHFFQEGFTLLFKGPSHPA